MTLQKKFEYLDENEKVIVLNDEMYPLYIVKGDKNYLIDCGVTARAKEFHRKIDEALKGDKIDIVLITHSHYDHVGALSYLQGIYDFKIAASYDAVELLRNPDIVEMIDHQNQEMKEQFNDFSSTKFEELKNIGGVGNGERIQVSEGRYFEVISTPGHSPCAISYLLYPEKILFPGDAAGMMEKSGKMRPVFFSGYREYESTLAKLSKMDIDALAFSHAVYIKGKDNVKEYIRKALDDTYKLKDWILFNLMKSRDTMEIVEDYLEKEYIPDSVMGTRESFLMNMRTLVKVIDRELISANYQ
jgi:glyoxylase-like metal-dependent hydrolase (beta-lactamase superfamily II)